MFWSLPECFSNCFDFSINCLLINIWMTKTGKLILKGKSWKYNSFKTFYIFSDAGTWVHILSPFFACKIVPELYIRICGMMLPKEFHGCQFENHCLLMWLGLWGTYQGCSYLKVSKLEWNTLPQEPYIIYVKQNQRMNLLLNILR